MAPVSGVTHTGVTVFGATLVSTGGEEHVSLSIDLTFGVCGPTRTDFLTTDSAHGECAGGPVRLTVTALLV